ncbi:MAG TPA: serine/threonine-protein kinase [Vicinamibacterales bacterium]|nr:serine/threonine-protein kinase [Vicinamibacterales bacterium]
MKQPVLVPKITPPPPPGSSGSAALPTDIVSEQARRIVLFSGVAAFMWWFGLTMDGLVLPAIVGVRAPLGALVTEAVAAVVMVAVFLHMRFGHVMPHAKCAAGVWVMLLNAAFITSLELSHIEMIAQAIGHPSWIAILILTAAMIMPSSPRRTFIASLAAAAMGPIGIGIAALAGARMPPLSVVSILYLPNFIWAVVATLPSAMFQRMGRQIKEARELGSYELVEQLGAGGMGSVWRARHRLLARDAAVKLVRPEALGETESAAQAQLRRFEREAQATATLQSEHSIRLFDFGTTEDGSFYYVMELLDGRDLESFVREFGPLPHERVMYLLRQVCHSLAEAHARGMVHRDIKPANIFLCRMGLEFDFVKVLDFGLVQTRRADPAMAETETLITAEKLIGTPAYMAPELILGRHDIDRRADVYAVGCVAFYLLTGTRVFQDGNQMQVLVDHVHAEPVPPSSRLGATLPREIDAFVLDCLRKNPADRPQDAGEMLERISAYNLAGRWSNTQARAWWQARLPELAAALPGAAGVPVDSY